MSNRAERDRQRRWNRKVLGAHKARTQVAHEMALYARAMNSGSRLLWPVFALMAECSSRRTAYRAGSAGGYK